MTGWRERPEGGLYWITAFYAAVAMRVGRTLASLALPLIAAYFLIVRRIERRESYNFLRRVIDRPVSLTDVYRHFRTFAQVVLDRIYLLASSNPPLTIEAEGLGELDRVLDANRGALLLGSHLGSFEASRMLSRHRPWVPVRILMDREVNANLSALLERVNPSLMEQLIDVSAGPAATMLSVRETFADGGLVAILGDRSIPGDKTATVDFLGGSVQLPTAPYLIAQVARVPIVLFFGFYIGRGRYRVVFERFADEPHAARNRGKKSREFAALAQRYAERLSRYTRRYPYNWFNFYPFWETGE